MERFCNIRVTFYEHAMPSRQVIALSVLILVLGGIRTMAVVFSPERCTDPADRRDLIAPGGRNGLP